MNNNGQIFKDALGCFKAIEQIPLETYIENKIQKLVYLHMDERQSNWFNFLYIFFWKTEKIFKEFGRDLDAGRRQRRLIKHINTIGRTVY